MGKLVYGAIASLDGYIEDASGGFGWAEPDDEVHAFVNELERATTTYLYGRRMYETMAGWETMDTGPDQPAVMRDFARLWRRPTRSSSRRRWPSRRPPGPGSCPGSTRRRCATWKSSTAGGLNIGGPTLAAHPFRAGLVDECHLFLHPVAVGGGKAARRRARASTWTWRTSAASPAASCTCATGSGRGPPAAGAPRPVPRSFVSKIDTNERRNDGDPAKAPDPSRCRAAGPEGCSSAPGCSPAACHPSLMPVTLAFAAITASLAPNPHDQHRSRTTAIAAQPAELLRTYATCSPPITSERARSSRPCSPVAPCHGRDTAIRS